MLDKYNNTATGLKYIKKKRSFKHLSTGQTSLLELNLKQLISKSRVAFKKGVLRATIRKKKFPQVGLHHQAAGAQQAEWATNHRVQSPPPHA